MASSEEWDWPPPRRSRAEQIELDSRIIEEGIVLPRKARRSAPVSPFAAKKAGAFETIVVTILKVVIAIPLAGVVIGCVWFLSVLLKA